MCEFMEKMANNGKNLLKEVNFTYLDIKNMSLEDIEINARKISNKAVWKDLAAEKLFKYKVLDAQSPNVLKKARGL